MLFSELSKYLVNFLQLFYRRPSPSDFRGEDLLGLFLVSHKPPSIESLCLLLVVDHPLFLDKLPINVEVLIVICHPCPCLFFILGGILELIQYPADFILFLYLLPVGLASEVLAVGIYLKIEPVRIRQVQKKCVMNF